MSARGLCWCGLNKDMHDGREMDGAGNMHRFNEIPAAERPPIIFDEDYPRVAGSTAEMTTSAPSLFSVRHLLESAESLLEQIIPLAQKGNRIPAGFVARAQGVKARISGALAGE